jgi:hypothetical protein
VLATPQPSVPSTQMRGGRDARLPRASPAAGVPEVIDVDPGVIDVDVNHAADASASESLARILADYGSGSDDTDPSKEVLQVIDVDQAPRQVADSRMINLRKKWTAQVKLTQQGKDREQVQLPDPLIEKLETMIGSKSKRAKNVRTSWSLEDKQSVLAVFRVLNRK